MVSSTFTLCGATMGSSRDWFVWSLQWLLQQNLLQISLQGVQAPFDVWKKNLFHSPTMALVQILRLLLVPWESLDRIRVTINFLKQYSLFNKFTLQETCSNYGRCKKLCSCRSLPLHTQSLRIRNGQFQTAYKLNSNGFETAWIKHNTDT